MSVHTEHLCPLCGTYRKIVQQIVRESEGTIEIHLECGHRDCRPLDVQGENVND